LVIKTQANETKFLTFYFIHRKSNS